MERMELYMGRDMVELYFKGRLLLNILGACKDVAKYLGLWVWVTGKGKGKGILIFALESFRSMSCGDRVADFKQYRPDKIEVQSTPDNSNLQGK